MVLRRPLFRQDALKGTNLRGQTEPKRRFSLILADSCLFLENIAFGKRRFSQKTADFRRIFAENRRNPQETAAWLSSPWVRPLKRGRSFEKVLRRVLRGCLAVGL